MAARDVKKEACAILTVCSLIESHGETPGRAWRMWRNARYRAIWAMLSAGNSVAEVALKHSMSRQGVYDSLAFGADLMLVWKDRRAVGRNGKHFTSVGVKLGRPASTRRPVM